MKSKPSKVPDLKSFWLVLLIAFSLFVLPLSVHTVKAQTPTPRDELIKAIQERAQQDVKLDKPAESIEGLNILFGEKAKTAGMSMTEVLNIYEDAYSAATPPKSWTDSIKPEYGWFVAAFLFVLFILRDIIKDNFTIFVHWLGKNIYKRVAGFKPFWWFSLRRYRRALVRKYGELNIPFRPGKPLKMHEVYVPIKVAGTSDTDLLDARQAMLTYKWLVVVGTPGSGKSMLLKNLALTYAQGELIDFPTQPIPIYLELNRLNESNAPLRDHLVEILDQNDFPNAGSFLDAGFTHGLLMLMLDGLDEVNSDLRESVTNKIKDLVSKYPNCRAVVTCRSAVYNEEFADLADQKLEIVEFSDQQIQRFLLSWAPYMPSDKSVEHLLRNLRERPRIMALARNPLLLTIIAYLYTDTEFVLPHSRAEFYDKSVTVLLEQWKEKRNRYKAAHKKLILQHLALFNQDSGAIGGQDRRSIDLPTTLEEIKKVLPSLTLKDEDALPILDEIVERSGLMIEIDGGTKYQFTHLTLQEFFAALALEADVTGLIKRYEADRDAWRESIKLWCGLTHNSTKLIRAIYSKDPIMAFECLGDAQQVDADFSVELSNTFKKRLGESGDNGEAIVRAFALVAADPRPRGLKLLDFLVSSLTDKGSTKKRRLSIAKALSLTNLPSAVEVLAKYIPTHPEIRPLLVQMGDLAVPILRDWAKEGNEWALDALHMIGTPLAANALIPLLWDKAETLNYQSAWRLASFLSKPNMETTFREFPLTITQRNTQHLNWIWEPFETNQSSPLRVIAGRVAYLLQNAPKDTIPLDSTVVPDWRLVIPLCSVGYRNKEDATFPIFEYRSKIQGRNQKGKKNVIQEYIAYLNFDDIKKFLFSRLPVDFQIDLLDLLQDDELTPNEGDWGNALKPLKYVFERSWHAVVSNILITFLGLLNIWGLAISILRRSPFFDWGNLLLMLNAIVVIVMLWIIWRAKPKKLDDLAAIVIIFVPSFSTVLGLTLWNLTGNWLFSIASILSGAVINYVVIHTLAIMDDMEDVNQVLFLPSILGIGIILSDATGSVIGNSIFNIINSLIGASSLSILSLLIMNAYLPRWFLFWSRRFYSQSIESDWVEDYRFRMGIETSRKSFRHLIRDDELRQVVLFKLRYYFLIVCIIAGLIGSIVLLKLGDFVRSQGITGGIIQNINNLSKITLDLQFIIACIIGIAVGVKIWTDLNFLRNRSTQVSTKNKPKRGSEIMLMVSISSILVLISCLFIIQPTKFLYETWSEFIVVFFWSIYLSIFGLVFILSAQQERRAKNPFHSLLNKTIAPSASQSPTHSDDAVEFL